ncbi:RCC1 and BTB domain-containing protein 1 [Cyphomyrmex costatus]|uniref:RCC1 and BTB domain-containing protein 1 n=1 Tax=Cyphomyrmex costatus TaxID=456900 RepID=A0A151I7A6_9HYME|nr:RCC1 and BTB domain-containing protein 1 [Cyphomyrmex costatus]
MHDHVTDHNFMTNPCKVVELSGKTIVKIVCGHFHTLALTDKGVVYAWGVNYKKQLSSLHKNKIISPFKI